MRAWELMKETLLRRRFILVVHLALLALCQPQLFRCQRRSDVAFSFA